MLSLWQHEKIKFTISIRDDIPKTTLCAIELILGVEGSNANVSNVAKATHVVIHSCPTTR